MKNYYRILPGRRNRYAQDCRDGNFVGADFKVSQSLEPYLSLPNEAFVENVRPLFMKSHPDKSKISAGLACGTLYTVAVTMKEGDIVLCRNQDGNYWIGEITGGYHYADNSEPLPHRRPVRWLERTLDKEE